MTTTVRTVLSKVSQLVTPCQHLKMNTSKVLSIVLLLSLVQGCRINQEVSIGGHIESSSGLYDCPEDQTCIVDTDIGGIFPAETYTAVPATGYRFAGWKDASGYICRGKTTACEAPDYGVAFTVLDIDIYLAPIFDIELMNLLPDTTRGVFQVYPGAPEAMDTTTMMASWGQGPLQILQRYSAGMDIADSARRLILAQLSDSTDEFILLANLDTVDVDTLSAGLLTDNGASYQGNTLWDIDNTDLQLVKLDGQSLVIGSNAAVEQALDVQAGLKSGIADGPLSGYLGALNVANFPNSFVYGLPALYGPVAAPGDGTTSLSQAYAVNSSFRVTDGVLSGALNFFTDNANTYRAKLLDQLVDKPTPVTYAFNNTLSVNLGGLSATDDIRPLLKTLFLDMDAVDYADAVVHGGNAPFLNFTVGEAPNSIFINFEFIGPQERADFEATHLPAGFKIAPIRILDTDAPSYFLVLNMYQSSGGLVTGARAEWSVFIEDPDTGEPRFLVVQAAAETTSADSVNLLTSPEPVTHTLEPTGIESYVGEVDPDTEVESLYFSSTIDWPQSPETRGAFHREFVVSNDYIFWGNGVADRGLYNSSVFNRDAVIVDPGQFSFVDNSHWADYINAAPTHTLVYLNPLNIVVSPWWNLSEDYLDLDIIEGDIPDADPTPTLTELTNFKNGFYPGLIKGNARSAIRGEGAALSSGVTAQSVPTASYHFPLLNANGLLADAGLDTHTPLAIELFDGEAPGTYLTLSVYQREGDPCGTRAEWITYVEGADGSAESVRLDAFAAEVCLDPVSLMTLATELQQEVDGGGRLNTSISSPFTRFEASVELDALAVDTLAGLNWLEATERSCSLNDICDDYYIDGQTLLAPVEQVGSAGVYITEITTPWDPDYIDTDAVRAGVRRNAAIQASNPWVNARSFAADPTP